MQRQVVPPSSLPTFIMPCPCCGQRMQITSIQPALLGPDLEDITHGCTHCGTELIRTVRLHAAPVAAVKPEAIPSSALPPLTRVQVA